MRAARCIALAAGALASMAGTAQATITVTRADTFNPGWFWSTFTYKWTITVSDDKGPFNDYEVTHALPGWKASLNMGSYGGPGAIAGAQPAGGIRVTTIAPGGFGSPLIGQITSNVNPNFVAGRLNFQITLGGTPVNAAATVALQDLPSDPTTTTGSTLVAFAPGTFPANTPIDLFQDTFMSSATAQLITYMPNQVSVSGADGSFVSTLNRPLLDPSADPLVIGVNGTLVYEIPSPGAAALALLGIVPLARRRR